MAIIVRCKRGAGDRQAGDIRDSLVSSVSMATARGKRFLDDPDQGGYYQVIRYSLRVPYVDAILPGDWITITETDKLGLTDQKLRVRSVSMSGGQFDSWVDLEADLYDIG